MTGIEIYKYLPKTNCKKCGFPTCLAFAMKVAQKQADISLCPELSPESRKILEEASRPPIKLISIGRERKIEVGNETVLFRHEKTFYHPPGIVIRIEDTEPPEDTAHLIREITSYSVQRVGLDLVLNGFALSNKSGKADSFLRLIETALNNTNKALVLISSNPVTMKLALEKAAKEKPLIYSATRNNWQEMSQLAQEYKCPLAVSERDSLANLAELIEQIAQNGVEDIVIDPGADTFANSVDLLTQLRRLAINKRCRTLGYPTITFPGDHVSGEEEEALLAAQHIAKYGGIIVLNNFCPAAIYPLLTLRLNIYTDPQKPVKVEAGMYPLNDPNDTAPLMVTTDFSLTYFSVAGEIQSSGFPSWLLICDTGGLSVLTAWAAGKFNAKEIAKAVKQLNVNDYVKHNVLIIPGYVAVIKGALEEELQGWKISVGPREAMDIGNYLKRTWRENDL